MQDTNSKIDYTLISDMPSVALIGSGKMGEAILRGWINSKSGVASGFVADNFVVVQPDAEVRARQVADYGTAAVASISELSDALDCANGLSFDIVVFAVKPQVMASVLSEVASLSAFGAVGPDTLFVTIAAGLDTSFYENALSGAMSKPRVVRVMPNMPLQVCLGASVVAAGKHATESDVELVNELFASLGKSFIVDEKDIDAVCAISGGGPAYFSYMIEALTHAGESLGLDPALTEALALQTLGGTYKAIVDTGVTPENLRNSVCSPGGTTLAALASMDSDYFTDLIVRAMEASVNRARELKEAK